MSKLGEIILDTLEAQADVFTMDEMAGHIERAILDAAGGPDHIVHVKGAAWTIQHPLSERFEAGPVTALVNCRFTTLVAATNFEEDGTFRVWLDRQTLLWEEVER